MPTVRLLPPNSIQQQTSVANGRTYAGTPGEAIDVRDSDAFVLSSNGWIQVAFSGPSAARPPTRGDGLYYIAAPGFKYFDTDLGKIVVYDGLAWRDPNDGAQV